MYHKHTIFGKEEALLYTCCTCIGWPYVLIQRLQKAKTKSKLYNVGCGLSMVSLHKRGLCVEDYFFSRNTIMSITSSI